VGAGPACVHAKQDTGPVVGLRPARTGIDFDIGVVAVGFARQKRLKLGPVGAQLERLQHGARFFDQALVAFQVTQLGELDGVLEFLFDGSHGFDRGRQLGALARHSLRLFRIVPQRRIFDPGIELIETS
jgi:hypothetical protein